MSPGEETLYWPSHPQLRMLGAGREDWLRSCNGWFTACKKKKSWGWGGLGDVTWRSKGGKDQWGRNLVEFVQVCGAIFVGKLKIF